MDETQAAAAPHRLEELTVVGLARPGVDGRGGRAQPGGVDGVDEPREAFGEDGLDEATEGLRDGAEGALHPIGVGPEPIRETVGGEPPGDGEGRG